MRTRLLAMTAALAWCGLSCHGGPSAAERTGPISIPRFRRLATATVTRDMAPPDLLRRPPALYRHRHRQPNSVDLERHHAAGGDRRRSTQRNWVVPPDSTYTYCGWGLGMGFGFPEGNRPTSGDLSQYTVSFDVKVEGYANSTTDSDQHADHLSGTGLPTEEYAIGVNGREQRRQSGQFHRGPAYDFHDSNLLASAERLRLIDNTEWDFTTLFARRRKSSCIAYLTVRLQRRRDRPRQRQHSDRWTTSSSRVPSAAGGPRRLR